MLRALRQPCKNRIQLTRFCKCRKYRTGRESIINRDSFPRKATEKCLMPLRSKRKNKNTKKNF